MVAKIKDNNDNKNHNYIILTYFRYINWNYNLFIFNNNPMVM